MNMRFIASVPLTVSLLSLGYMLATQSKEVKPKVGGDPVIAAAGDIACDPKSPNYNKGSGTADACHMKATSDLILNAGLAAVLPLGDIQYETGTASAFQQSYNPTWGRVKSITHPAVGNHEYATTGAKDYYRYFGTAAGNPAKGYYSYDIGSWHAIALNSNCSEVGGCGTGSLQEQWLKADLKAHAKACLYVSLLASSTIFFRRTWQRP